MNQTIQILLVDDNRGDYVLIDRMLREVRPGAFTVTWAATFEEGTAAFVREPPDVFLIDYRLGSAHNGLDLLQLVTAQQSESPVIVLTGQGDANTDMEAMWLGAADYLVKDRLDGATLERAIRYALERKRLETALRRTQRELEKQVKERTAHLNAIKQQLQEEITERERAEAQLQQVQKLDAVGRVVSGVAHDFNNYLGVMRGYLEMALESTGRSTPTHRYLLNVLQSANKSTRLVKQLLTFSSQHPVEKHILNLNGQLRTSQKLLQRVLTERIAIKTDLALDLWAITADPNGLDQVLMNLAVNARDAMPNGGTLTIQTRNISTVDAKHLSPEASGECVCLSVSDTGMGMSRDVQARIFEPFFTTKGSGGTGLGLSVAYGIVRAHGGWIDVQSLPGRGSRFTIYFPAQPHEIVAEESVEEPEALVMPDGGGERILVVEDDVAFGEMIREILIKNGYDAVLCGTAREAREIFQQEIPDMVLSDQVLPDGRGTELVQRFARDMGKKATLLMTGYPEEWIRKEIGEPIKWVFLQKPMPIHDLLTHVKTILAQRT